MQLIDLNHLILRALFKAIGNHTNVKVEETLVRAMSLNIIRSIRKKFVNDYGELVICADGHRSWRKEVFPYYKANRKKGRDESELDWTVLFEILNAIRDELRDFFPYKFIYLDHIEADDIIATICHEFGNPMNTGEKILIHSNDKDFIQLQVYGNVSQFDPIKKTWIVHPDPELYKFEHIVRGDKGDGIPNILSSDNSLILNERQKTITSKKLETFATSFDQLDELTKIRFYRNKTLIDLNEIPEKHRQSIMEQYNKPTRDRSKLFSYFIDKKLKQLMTNIQDF